MRLFTQSARNSALARRCRFPRQLAPSPDVEEAGWRPIDPERKHMPDEVQRERSTAIQPERERSSKVLKALFIAFILLILAVIAGVYWDWPKLPESMEQ